jgi:hypothetical protein
MMTSSYSASVCASESCRLTAVFGDTAGGCCRNDDVGEELDAQLVARTERMALTLKYADYRADALFTDTDKLWLSVDYAF